jgi:hypothetical protein
MAADQTLSDSLFLLHCLASAIDRGAASDAVYAVVRRAEAGTGWWPFLPTIHLCCYALWLYSVFAVAHCMSVLYRSP